MLVPVLQVPAGEEGGPEGFPNLQLLLQGSFHQEEVKQPRCRDTQRPNIMNDLGLLRHQLTCHWPPFPFCQNSATPVVRTSKKTACLSTCW